MKGFKVAALAAVACIMLATSVFAADFAAVHKKQQELAFRTHIAATASPVDFLGGYADSALATRLGTQVFVFDTTRGINTDGWHKIQPGGGVTDTMAEYATLNIFDATGSASASAADSLYIAVQGSLNGANWATLRTFKNGTVSAIASRLDQTNVTGAFQGLLSVNGASQAGGGASMWRYVLKSRGSAIDAVDVGSVASWPLLRFIVGFPDAVKYSVGASVTYWSSKDE